MMVMLSIRIMMRIIIKLYPMKTTKKVIKEYCCVNNNKS